MDPNIKRIENNIPKELFALAKLFSAAGHTLYAVGGLVRNSLLALPVSDIDICSAMRPDDVVALCRENGFTVVPKGIAFGMVEVHINGEKFEHTTFRSDCYTEGGAHRPSSISFSDTPSEDAFRRDFSVNALYYDILSGELIDPTGGLADLEQKLIRTTSPDPMTVLGDDGLRIMRLIRFAGELDFCIDRRSFECAASLNKNLNDISFERIRDELNKLLLCDVKYGERSSEKVMRALEKFRDIGALEIVLPELYSGRGIAQRAQYHRYDVLDHCLHSASEASPSLTLRLAALLHDVGKPPVKMETGLMHGHDLAGADIARNVLKRLKYDNRTIDDVVFLVKHHMFDLNNTAKNATLRRSFARWGYERSLALCDIRRADFLGSGIIKGSVASADRWEKTLRDMKAEGAPFSESELNCTGDDIMNWLSLPPGPEVALVKKRMLAHCAVRPQDNTIKELKRAALGMLHSDSIICKK